VFGPADAPAVWIVVAGAISLETLEGPATSARAGDTVGLYAALAGQAIDRTAHAIRPGFALRIDGDDLFDLLSQRDTLLEQLFASLFRTRTGPSG
jgi:CRP-like cAMP-binding protein